MDTERSDRKAASFLRGGKVRESKTQTYERRFSFPPEIVFPQLCPSRELDWIPGWDCDLVHTSTGYAEDGCVFSTPATNALGDGIWVFTHYQPDQLVEVVRVGGSTVTHLRITLVDHHDGACTGIWNLRITALNGDGNEVVASRPDHEPGFEKMLDGLEHFLRTGRMLRSA
jgi:hypothetical protein